MFVDTRLPAQTELDRSPACRRHPDGTTCAVCGEDWVTAPDCTFTVGQWRRQREGSDLKAEVTAAEDRFCRIPRVD